MTLLRKLASAAVVLTACASVSVQAATAPAALQHLTKKPVTLVVPFPPGAAADNIGRLVADGLGEALGTSVVVQNLPGATGTIGAATVARASADGSTLLLRVSASQIIAPLLMTSLPYDAEHAFKPVARITSGGQLVLAHPSFPADDIQGMLQVARDAKEPYSYGSWGYGSGGHLALANIALEGDIDLVHVPYKGGAPMYQDLIGGHILLSAGDIGTASRLIRDGAVKALATTGTERSSILPDVPTLREQGLSFGVDNWTGIFAPAATPDDVVDALYNVITDIVESPAVQEQIAKLGTEYKPVDRKTFQAEMQTEKQTWSQVIKAGDIKVN